MRSLLVALAALVLWPGCSLLLSFDDDVTDGPPPPDASLDGPPDAPPRPDAGPDVNEPNDDMASATPITPGSHGPYTIFPVGDHDVYSFVVPADGTDVTIEIQFVHAEGDLDMRLRDAAWTIVATANSFTDNETLTCTAMGGGHGPLNMGTYYIEVFGFSDEKTNFYTLSLDIP